MLQTRTQASDPKTPRTLVCVCAYRQKEAKKGARDEEKDAADVVDGLEESVWNGWRRLKAQQDALQAEMDYQMNLEHEEQRCVMCVCDRSVLLEAIVPNVVQRL